MNALELIVGNTYGIVDWFGMMGMEGTYIGVARDEANYGSDVLVFSFVSMFKDAPPIRYAGCTVDAHIGKGYNGEPDKVGVTMRAAYYGDTVAGLKHVTDHRKEPRWEIRQS